LQEGAVLSEEGYLRELREITQDNNLLFFDEIITGFRLAPGGAQQYYAIIPNLSTFGKAIANGFLLLLQSLERKTS